MARRRPSLRGFLTLRTIRLNFLAGSTGTLELRAGRITMSVWPTHGHKIRSNDMPVLGGTLVCNVMGEVSAVPHHYILPENRFTIYPFADLGISVDAGRRVKSIVDLVAVVTENPNVPGAKRPV